MRPGKHYISNRPFMTEIENTTPYSKAKENWIRSFVDYEYKSRLKQDKEYVIFTDEEINTMLNSITTQ